MMGRICERLDIAFRHVAANRGAPGPDRQSIEEVREHLPEVLSLLTEALLSGSYRPGDIRRVWIPKAGGGERGLGIRNAWSRRRCGWFWTRRPVLNCCRNGGLGLSIQRGAAESKSAARC